VKKGFSHAKALNQIKLCLLTQYRHGQKYIETLEIFLTQVQFTIFSLNMKELAKVREIFTN